MNDPLQIRTILEDATRRLETLSESARLDAELLLAECLHKPRSFLYSWPERTLTGPEWLAFENLVQKRLRPTPVAYLLGYREFYSLIFHTDEAALIPRPETELLVDLALQILTTIRQPRVLELGTGTGAISIALLKHRPDIDLITTDISDDCLQLALKNAEENSVKLNCIQSNWYQNLHGQDGFDLIVSNPPYIAADDPYLDHGDLPAEPALALTPGPSGLEAIEQIFAGAPEYLRPGGFLLIEHGYDQAEAVARLFEMSGYSNIICKPDINRLPRASYGQIP